MRKICCHSIIWLKAIFLLIDRCYLSSWLEDQQCKKWPKWSKMELWSSTSKIEIPISILEFVGVAFDYGQLSITNGLIITNWLIMNNYSWSHHHDKKRKRFLYYRQNLPNAPRKMWRKIQIQIPNRKIRKNSLFRSKKRRVDLRLQVWIPNSGFSRPRRLCFGLIEGSQEWVNNG